MGKEKIHDEINRRFKELILRDPLFKSFISKYKTFVKTSPINDGIIAYPKHIDRHLSEITSKWNIPFIRLAPSGDFAIQKKLSTVLEHKPMRLIENVKIPFMIEDDIGKLFVKQKGHVYIDIDLTSLDLNDERIIKNEVWRIVKTKISNRKNVKSQKKGSSPSHPIGDPPELARFYHINNFTFDRYLRWYDIHTQEKYGFRLIAFIESQFKDNPVKKKNLLARIKKMPKSPKVKTSTKGEDAVEKGIKLIYKAIYRKSYSKKNIEPITEEYNCPQHGNDCPAMCSHLQDWYNRIKRLYPDN